MQLLPPVVQELLVFRPENEKPHRSSSLTGMNCRRRGSPWFGLGSGVGPSGVVR
jgi:hypothetical protein